MKFPTTYDMFKGHLPFRTQLAACLLAIATLGPCLQAQDAAKQSTRHNLEYGTPPYQLFSKSEAMIDSEILCIAFDKWGSVYLGHHSGISRFDGTRWVPLQGVDIPVARIAIGEDLRIYYSNENDFGYLKSNGAVAFEAVSLQSEVSKAEQESLSIDHILADKDFTYYVSTNQIFKLDGETLDIAIFDSKEAFTSNPFANNGTFWIGNEEGELLRLDEQGLHSVYEFSQSGERGTIVTLFASKAHVLAGITGKDRFFSYDGKDVTVHQKLTSLKSRTATSVFELDDGSILATIGKDIDRFKGIDDPRIQSMDTTLSDFPILANQAALSPDKSQLWISNGISAARILVNSPSTRFSTQHGIQTKITDIRRFNDTLFLDTGESIRVANYNSSGMLLSFKSHPELNSSTSHIVSASDEGLVIYADGRLYGIDEHTIFSPSPPASKKPLTKFSETFAITESRRLRVFEKTESGWPSTPATSYFDKDIKDFVVTKDGEIWTSLKPGRITKVSPLSQGLKKTIYEEQHALPPENLKIALLDGAPAFIASDRILRFDETQNLFVRDELYDFIFEHTDKPQDLWRDSQERLWVASQSKTGVFMKNAEGVNVLNTSPLDPFIISQPQYLYTEKTGEIWFGSHYGLIKCDGNAITELPPPPGIHISRITKLGEQGSLYDYTANGENPAEKLHLKSSEKSVRIELGTSDLNPVRKQSIRYRIGENTKWSDWSKQDAIELINIPYGTNRLQLEAKTESGERIKIEGISFIAKKPFYLTSIAFVGYAACLAIIYYILVSIQSLRLKRHNRKLEALVEDRTIELKNKAEILSKTMDELHEAQGQLVESARLAGKADVATSILHNVGNVMNSVILSMNRIKSKSEHSRITVLGKTVHLMEQNKESFAAFLTQDERGKRLPELLSNLNDVLLTEQKNCLAEIDGALQGVSHVTSIVSSQQQHARMINVVTEFSLHELVSNALAFGLAEDGMDRIQRAAEIPTNIQVASDQHLLLQIVTNLIKNAAESVMEFRHLDGRIVISAISTPEEPGQYVLKIHDNGHGFSEKSQERLFSSGFTTKKEGHGFGLHFSAIGVKQLGGTISIESDGAGKGATVILRMPVKISSHG